MSSAGKFTLLAALFLCIFSVCGFSSPARADYQLCNASSYILEAASARESAEGWRSQGWLRLAPGACGILVPGPAADGDIYIFGRSVEVHQGPTKYFSGTDRFCTLPGDFSIAGRENCALRGYESYDFIRVTTKAGDNWTTTLREPRDYSLEQARIAGAQRLLRDNGFSIQRIDGALSKTTTRTVMSYQRSRNMTPNGTIDDALIGALSASAAEEQAKFGLNLCNRTNHLLWAAIGYAGADEDVSNGWIRVEAQSCSKAIKGKLKQQSYYVYAEATDEKGMLISDAGRLLRWSGSDSFCTKSTRFEIKGRESCMARGFDERKFKRIETGGKPRFDMELN